MLPADEYTQELHDNFIRINESLRSSTDEVISLINDTLLLSNAAMKGRLTVRAEEEKHQGDYRKIIAGFNGTLDAFISPVGELFRCVLRRYASNMPF